MKQSVELYKIVHIGKQFYIHVRLFLVLYAYSRIVFVCVFNIVLNLII